MGKTLDRPEPDEVKGMDAHVSHEIERILRLGEVQRRWSWLLRLLPFDTIRRALRVAYATHARAVLEFFHDGRPDHVGERFRRRDGDIDVWLCDYTGRAAGAYAWTRDHQDRLADADKLAGHLSTGRLVLDRALLPNWGDREDRLRFRALIETIMRDVPNARERFTGAHLSLRETMD